MEEFTDNQTVSATSLNQIAIDLGRPTFSNFADNKAYNVDKLNEITADIVSAGIANSVGNRCRCTLSNGNIVIDTGLIFFNSGAKMKLDSTVSLSYEISDTQRYVYAHNDTSLNIIRIISDEAAPSGDLDTVMLCTVVSGAVSDARVFAKAKIALPAAQAIYSEEISGGFNSGRETIIAIIDNNQEYSMCMAENVSYGKNYSELIDNDTVEIKFSVNNVVITIKIKKEGTKYTISGTKNGSGSTGATFKIYLV